MAPTRPRPRRDGTLVRFRHVAVPGLVSVVMPCYNAEPFVAAAVASVWEQTYPAVQLIVVDDGSTDGSGALLRASSREHPERMVLLTQANRGPAPARNAALAEARGEFVAFLDADDYWSPRCLAQMVEGAQRSRAPLVYCGWQNVGDGGPGSAPFIPPDYGDGDAAAEFLRECPWPIHAALMRRDLLERVGGFSERYFASTDYDLWLRILGLGERFALVPKVLAFYRWHGEDQISARRRQQEIDAWRVRRDFVRRFPARVAHLTRARRRSLLHGALASAAHAAWERRDLATARVLFRHALLHRAAGLGSLGPALLSALVPDGALLRLLRATDRRAV